MENPAVSDEVAMKKMRAVLAAHDTENILWPPKNSEFAVKILRKTTGFVPSIDEVASEIGIVRANAMLQDIFDSRKFENAALGYRSPCHYCGSTDDLVHHDFALMRVEEVSRKWGETAASIVLSAVLFPVTGGGVIRLPEKSFQGAAVHLRLVVCKACRIKNSNLFGIFIINEQSASRHPFWSQLVEAGFTKLLKGDRLPSEFKYRVNTSL